MKNHLVAIMMAMGLFSSIGAMANTKVLINSIPRNASYLPQDIIGFSLKFPRFEVNPQNNAVRIAVDYDYVGDDDDETGPGTTHKMLPELTYDANQKAVLYTNNNGVTSVCGQGIWYHNIFQHIVAVKIAYPCTITLNPATHTVWDGDHFQSHDVEGWDVYFEAP